MNGTPIIDIHIPSSLPSGLRGYRARILIKLQPIPRLYLLHNFYQPENSDGPTLFDTLKCIALRRR